MYETLTVECYSRPSGYPQPFGSCSIDDLSTHLSCPTSERLASALDSDFCDFCRYSQFQKEYSTDEIQNSPVIFDPLTKLQCW